MFIPRMGHTLRLGEKTPISGTKPISGQVVPIARLPGSYLDPEDLWYARCKSLSQNQNRGIQNGWKASTWSSIDLVPITLANR